MNETASDRARRLMKEVDSASLQNYSKGEVKTILNSIAQCSDIPAVDDAALGCRAPAKVATLMRGDVFIATLVGGKVRPWVVLAVDGDFVSAVALSSGESAPGMIKSKCRYWPSSWIGCTVSAFSLEMATREVTRPYTNLRHLAEVERTIAERHGMKVSRSRGKTVQSVGEILTRMKDAAK